MKLLAKQNSLIQGFYKPKYQLIFLGVIWLSFQVLFLWKNGIVITGEAGKYINQATLFLNSGKFSSQKFLFYSIQILLIAFCLKLQFSFLFVVFIQVIVNGISILFFYKLVSKLSCSPLLPFFSTVYFLLFFYYHIYNTFLYTESLFFSFSVIYTYFLFTRENFNAKNFLLILLFLALLYFTRPTGIFFLPATFLFIVIKFSPRNAYTIILIVSVAVIIAFYFLLNYSLHSGGEFDFLLPYLKENIICGVSTIQQQHNFSVPVEKNSIAGLLYIITHHFQLFARLGFQKLLSFFGIYRPFYSSFHNIFAMSYFYVLYIIIITGIKNLFVNYKAEVWFLLCNIWLMAISVMVSCDEWSNRFILSVLPSILLLGVISIENNRKRIV